MKIVISGTSGYLGQNLIQKLNLKGHTCVNISRKNLYSIPDLTTLLQGTDLVIHLAGAPILRRWTKKIKSEILDSRVVTTQNISKAIRLLPESQRPHSFISASAIGIYATNYKHDETSTNFSTDFVGEVVQKWESSSAEMPATVRKINFRIGLVLGKEAKTITKLLPIFKLGLGGRIGSGEQAFPFVHINDVVEAFTWAVENIAAEGIYNLVAPESISNKQFTKALAHQLRKPAIFPVPAFALKLLYGEASTLLLQSPEVYPKRLLNQGFIFTFPNIKSCFDEIIA